jgi:hypothetical protein
MATIVISCLKCCAEIDTRIEVDAETFAHLPASETKMVCPSCGAEGFWDKSRAVLRERPAA